MADAVHHPVPGLNAHRHPSSPIAQPMYTFDQVPHAEKSLEGSVIQEVTSREAFKEIMAEMVLLCKEAMKRNKSVKTASKPLSLEYIADRLDVDDPCFGYIIRSKEGYLQGFITVTTFTNWQKNFKWDSLNEVSFYYDGNHEHDDDDDDNDDDSDDEEEMEDGESDSMDEDDNDVEDDDDEEYESRKPSARLFRQSSRKPAAAVETPAPAETPRKSKAKSSSSQLPQSARERRLSSVAKRPKTKRVIDEDGSLAKDLQNTVRLGDPYNEGIVWPRIAEISLLGAIGCGKALVDLVIEQLEFQRGSATSNYDYIALQATDNSIPFYETQGFVRVGAVTYDSKLPTPHSSPMKPRKNSSGGFGDENSGDSDSGNEEASSRSSSPAFTETSISSHRTSSSESAAADAEEVEPSSPDKPNALARPSGIVASPHFQFTVDKPGDTPNEIAKRFKVDIWDLIFLNKDVYPDLRPCSRLMQDTILYVPERVEPEAPMEYWGRDVTSPKPFTSKAAAAAAPAATPTKWFVTKENDTPRKVAQQFGIPCNKLVAANRHRLPELQATSRLKKGTRLKVSNLDTIDEIAQPYCHWSFPDDTHVEGGDPSYMMVRRLDRKTARNPRFVRDSFAVPVSKYNPPKLLFPPPPKNGTILATQPAKKKARQSSSALSRLTPTSYAAASGIKMPKKPSRPAELSITPPEDGKIVYAEHQKEMHPEFINETLEITKIIHDRWSRLGHQKKDRYHEVARQARRAYDQVNKEYQSKLRQWKKECKRRQEAHEEGQAERKAEVAATAVAENEHTLFNSVVKLREDALEGKDYKYWYVLTFIPDLKWCHLVPMAQEGIFGPERKRSHGRPRYRLVDEKLALELDISSTYCIPVKARALKRSNDADKEEWDVIDNGEPPFKPAVIRRLSSGYSSAKSAPKASSSKKAAPSAASARKKTQKQTNAEQEAKMLAEKAALAAAANHVRDPFKRTRSSPISSGRARVELEEHDAIPIFYRERKRRRCMRCVESGGSPAQAIVCLGAKGRFGRAACEYFDASGERVKMFDEPTPGRTTPSGRKPRRCTRCLEFGASVDQAMGCPGAKGRYGKNGCIYFNENGEERQADEGTADSNEEISTIVSAEESHVEVMLDTTNKKRKRFSVDDEDAADPLELHSRKSRRVTAPVSYAE